MLYNVLPPLIFFVSLGGTILVVSRVVLRVRRDQMSAELQSHVTQVSKSRLNKVQDLAGILAPNQISVHSFKNRMSFLSHNIKKASARFVLDIKDWRTPHRAARTARKHESKANKILMKSDKKANKKKEQVEAQNSSSDIVIPPSSRLKDSLKKIIIQAKGIKAKSQTTLKKYTTEVADTIKEQQNKPKNKPKTKEPIEKKISTQLENPVATHGEKSPVIRKINIGETEIKEQKKVEAQTKTKEQNKTAPLSKFFKKEQKKDVLEQAKNALADAQIQKVEDILVPYIIKHPKNTSAYMMLGKAAISRKDWTEATEIFEQVTRIKPETKGCYAALGQAAYKSGNLTKAIEALQHAHNQSPKNTQVIKRLIKIANHLDNQPMKKSLTEELKLLEQEIILDDQSVRQEHTETQ